MKTSLNLKENFLHMILISDYNQMIQSKIKINKRLKVAIDCGNAAGCIVVPDLYEKFNIDLYKLYCDIDGSFPNHHPDPTVDSNLIDLQNLLLKINVISVLRMMEMQIGLLLLMKMVQ